MTVGIVTEKKGKTGLATVRLTCPPACGLDCKKCKIKYKGDFLVAVAINTAHAEEGDKVELVKMGGNPIYQYAVPFALMLIAFGVVQLLGGSENLAWLIGMATLTAGYFAMYYLQNKKRGKKPQYEIKKIMIS